MSHPTAYTSEAITDSDGLTDIRIHIDGKTWHLWGRNCIAREKDMAAIVPDGTLPVLIGSGLGYCLKSLLDQERPVAVVDRENAIHETTGLRKALSQQSNLLWVDAESPEACVDQLTRWQTANGGKPFAPVIIPLYLRLDRPYYGTIAETLKANTRTDFWSQARYPKFQAAKPRVLFFDSNYFLCGEIRTALEKLGIKHQTIELEQGGIGSQDFIETLLRAVVDFRPDFILTVNHFGLDREGKLAGLLSELGLPLASWFVDNPHLILHSYVHPGTDNTAIFTYDAGNLDQMRAKGFTNVHYLPLATDPTRFKPGDTDIPSEWKCDISFVGNSMTAPVANSLRDAALPDSFLADYEAIAKDFGASDETSVEHFLSTHHPDWHKALNDLPTAENRLALESLITWEATRQYRLACVRQIIGFNPLIVGDNGWHDLLSPEDRWHHLPGLDYYEELPHFYPASKINFNCTSRQMVGAVNQRVFDVPACGGFVLTDHREQMENLFDLDSEVAIYRTPDEIPDRVENLLQNDHLRKKITTAARKRILAEHTYEIRLERLMAIMRDTFL